MQDAGGETLADFLYRVAHDLDLLDLWRHGGADAVLEQEGMKLLRPEHVDVLRSGNLELIDVALKEEKAALGDDDVTAHQHGHWGPCWVLVG